MLERIVDRLWFEQSGYLLSSELLYVFIDSILHLNTNKDHFNTRYSNKMMTNDFIYIVLA